MLRIFSTKTDGILFSRRKMALIMLLAFFANTVLGPVCPAWAQAALPLPSSMLTLSSGYTPTLIKGIRVYRDNPLRFDFIVDPGDSKLQGQDFEAESSKLIKYFLASLTVPDKDMWVNLSPYEKDRIIPDAFGKTEMGRDMLGQDYILKQLTSSLIYPESELGKLFWTMAYQKAQEALGSTDIAVNTLNKIWIVPEKAVVYTKNNIAYVVETHLKVMLEEDFFALQENREVVTEKVKDTNIVGSQAIRQIILPAIEKEINGGRNFAPLRQVYNSLILATWFKRNLKESILAKVYVGQNKIDGVTFAGKTNKERIYQNYLEAFDKGVYNYIKEEEDSVTHEMVVRKYFSGGVTAMNMDQVLTEIQGKGASSSLQGVAAQSILVLVEMGPSKIAMPDVPADESVQSFSAGPFNIMRDNRSAVAQQSIWSGKFGATGRTLTMPDITPETITLFQKAIAANADSPYPSLALRNLLPVTDYLLRKLSQEAELSFSERDELSRRSIQIKSKLAPVDALEKRVAEAKAQADEGIAVSRNQTGTSAQMQATVQKALVDAEMKYSALKDELVELSLRIKARQLRKTLAQITPQLEKAAYISKMPFFLRSKNSSDADIKELLKVTAGVVNDLSSAEVAQLLQAAQVRAQDMLVFLSKTSQSEINFVGLNVSFVLNTPEVFTVKTSADGNKVLEVDLMSFMKEPSKTQIVAWRYDFLSALARVERAAEVTKFARKMGSQFIAQNAAIVSEIMRTLIFMKNVVDPYYQIGPYAIQGTVQEVAQVRSQFLDELSKDGHYSQLTQLVGVLGENVSSYKLKEGEQKIPNMRDRIESVLLAIQVSPRLEDTARMYANYNQKDIVLMAELYINLEQKSWFSASPTATTVSPVTVAAEVTAAEVQVATTEQSLREKRAKQAQVEALDVASEAAASQPDILADETLGDVALQWVARQIRTTAETISSRINVRQWVLSGAVAVMGLFVVGNLSQEDVETAMLAQNPQILAPTIEQLRNKDRAFFSSLKRLEPGDSATILELIKNIKELKRLQAKLPTPQIAAAIATVEAKTVLSPVTYTVKVNDTLGDIAINFGKNSVSGAFEIMAANSEIVTNLNVITPGMVLNIPGTEEVAMTLGANESMKRVIETMYGDVTPRIMKKFFDENPGVKINSDLTPSMTVTAKLSVEQANRFRERQSARAQKISALTTENVGGINLDTTGLEIRVEGDNFKFDVPVDPQILQNLQREPINGLVPVILNVVPILNLPQFLGVQSTAEIKDSLALSR